MTSCFKVNVESKIARLTFNRPEKRNSLLPEFWSDFPQAIRELSNSGDVRCIIVDSEGPVFSAGMDLSVFMAQDKFRADSAIFREQLRNLILTLQDALNVVEKSRCPVIAAVQGGCLGAGLDLICACDLRFATDDAFFCIQEINIGIMADMGTLQRLPRKMPDAVVREMAFTGSRLPVQRAMQLGFVNEVFPTQETMNTRVMEVANAIVAKPPLVVSATKECIDYSIQHSVSDSLLYAANLQSFIFDPEDVMKQVKKTNEAAEHANLKPVPVSL